MPDGRKDVQYLTRSPDHIFRFSEISDPAHIHTFAGNVRPSTLLILGIFLNFSSDVVAYILRQRLGEGRSCHVTVARGLLYFPSHDSAAECYSQMTRLMRLIGTNRDPPRDRTDGPRDMITVGPGCVFLNKMLHHEASENQAVHGYADSAIPDGYDVEIRGYLVLASFNNYCKPVSGCY